MKQFFKRSIPICIVLCVLCGAFLWLGQGDGQESDLVTYIAESEKIVDGVTRQKNLYDERGNLTDIIEYDDNGNESSREYWRYNENDKILEEGYYRDGALLWKRSHTYDNGGNRLKTFGYDQDGTEKLLIQNTYDGKGNLIEKLNYEMYDGQVLRTANKYDDDGRLIESADYKDGEQGTRRVYEYDSRGNQSLYALYEGEICFRHWETEYDKNGNMVKSSRYENGTLYAYAENKYNSQGKQIEKTNVTVGVESSKTIWEYDAEGKIRYTARYKNGVETYRTEYVLDSNSNKIETKEYENGSLVAHNVSAYGQNSKLLKSESASYKDGQKVSDTVCLYNKDGKIDNETIKYSSGNVSREEYVYNEKGLLIAQNGYSNNELKRIFGYERDSNGYVIKETTFYEGRDKAVLYKRDVDGNMTERQWQTNDGKTIVMKYKVLKISSERADFIEKELHGEIMY